MHQRSWQGCFKKLTKLIAPSLEGVRTIVSDALGNPFEYPAKIFVLLLNVRNVVPIK